MFHYPLFMFHSEAVRFSTFCMLLLLDVLIIVINLIAWIDGDFGL